MLVLDMDDTLLTDENKKYCLDMDDTLLTDDHIISEENKEMLFKAKKWGFMLFWLRADQHLP